MIEKIISGGQIGTDIAALRAAKSLGIPTGGAMPRGFLTKSGNRPEYEKEYCCHELRTMDYPTRTAWNIENSDGTLRIAKSFSTRGEICTMKFIDMYSKPSFDIDISQILNVKSTGEKVEHIKFENFIAADWIMQFDIKTLNIAGNALPEIEGIVTILLRRLFMLTNKIKEV